MSCKGKTKGGEDACLAWENVVGDEQRHDGSLQLDLLDILPRPFGGLLGEVLHQDMLQARRDRVALGTARKAGSGEILFKNWVGPGVALPRIQNRAAHRAVILVVHRAEQAVAAKAMPAGRRHRLEQQIGAE